LSDLFGVWRGAFTVTACVSLVQTTALSYNGFNIPFGLLACGSLASSTQMALKQKKSVLKWLRRPGNFPSAWSQSHIQELGWVEAVECLPQLLAWGVLFSHHGAALVAVEPWTLGLAQIQPSVSPMQLLMFLGMGSSSIK